MKKFINQMEPTYGREERAAVADYLSSGGWLMEFRKTEEFEKAICEFTGAKYCSVLPNGTVTLFLSLMAAGVGRGDEVIVPDFTMIATPNSVKMVGASPVLVDVDDSLCMDPLALRQAITKKTKAVMHVSINGRAGQLDKIKKICREKGLILIEDAAQSLGSYYRGKHLGRHGLIGSFSFSAHKIITTGQGGALITDDRSIYEKIEKLKDFGRIRPGVDVHDQVGWNFKFTDIQASFGLAQIKKIDIKIKRKKEIYNLYQKLLGGINDVQLINTDTESVSPWFMEILVPNPKDLSIFLKENNVGSRPFYPAIHSQIIYKKSKGRFTKSTMAGERGLWLPSSLSLKDSEIKYICDLIYKFYKK